MNVIDLGIIILLFVFVYKDYRKGFTGVLFSLLAIIAGLYLATKLYGLLSPYVGTVIDSKQVSDIVAFVFIFIIINFGINRLGEQFKELLEKLYLNWVNRLLGGGVGFAKGFLLVGAFLMMATYLSIAPVEKELKKSKVAPYVKSSFGKLFWIAADVIPNDIKEKGKDFVIKHF